MIVGVISVLVGQAILLDSKPRIAWALAVIVINGVYIP
jgi:hypothetical protein